MTATCGCWRQVCLHVYEATRSRSSRSLHALSAGRGAADAATTVRHLSVRSHAGVEAAMSAETISISTTCRSCCCLASQVRKAWGDAGIASLADHRERLATHDRLWDKTAATVGTSTVARQKRQVGGSTESTGDDVSTSPA
jgi:hypothetical protein